MDIIPAWMIEDLEKLRKEQQGAEQLVLRIELPLYDEQKIEENPLEDKDMSIVIPLR